MRTLIATLSLAASLATAAVAGADGTLAGFASLPADTFEPPGGNRSGQFITEREINGRTPPFDRQPICGISAVVAGDEPGTFLALADNGYGTKANSADFLLSVYRVRPIFNNLAASVAAQGKHPAGTVKIEVAFRLSDPDKHITWPIVADGATYPNSDIAVPEEVRQRRILTGGDLDPESMVRLGDGTFWIGDEYGPFLLHVDKDGKLLEPPVDLMNLPGADYQSVDHPLPGNATGVIPRSGGFEGLALLSHGKDPVLRAILTSGLTFGFYPMMSKRAIWDDADSRFPEANVVEFPLEEGQAIGDYVQQQGIAILIEHDSHEGPAASFKRLQAWVRKEHRTETEISTINEKRLVADLLNLPDPHDLNGDGGRTFRFPFLTPGSLLVIDERTVLVINDNNYPFTSGRAPAGGGDPQPDPTEFILIRFDKPLAELGE